MAWPTRRAWQPTSSPTRTLSPTAQRTVSRTTTSTRTRDGSGSSGGSGGSRNRRDDPEVEVEEPQKPSRNLDNIRAELRTLLEQFGLATPGLLALIEQAIQQDWSVTRFTQEMRQHGDYLANPLFAANIERAAEGHRFKSEAEVLNYADEVKRLSRQFGYAEPSNNYIAMGIKSGKSLGEVEHVLAVQTRVNEMGAGVAAVYREVYGHDPSDQDLFDIFDPDKDTKDVDDALKAALYRGRPFVLGLGIRSETEQRALEMLGVNPDEAWDRWQGVAANAPRVQRLQAIEEMVAGNLPTDFGSHLATEENALLVRALVFQDAEALAKLQNATAREIARFNTGSGVARQGTAAVGLLSPDQR